MGLFCLPILFICPSLSHPVWFRIFCSIPHQTGSNSEVLCQYEYYIDVKRADDGKIGLALSKTGLKALACNLKVIDGTVK